MKRSIALTLAVLMALAMFGTASAKKKKKGPKSGPLVVGTDAAGDWGGNVDPTIAPIGNGLGQDLTEAVIEMGEDNTVNFIIKVNSLPSNGGVPEISRYVWDMTVDGEFVELDGKWSNYSRGTCDPTSGRCPPPRDPGMQPFFVRGNCGVVEGTNVTTCEELGIVHATFDPAAKTITVPVPLELINAKNGSKIAPGTNIFGGSLSASPAAFVTNNSMPMDTMVLTETFVVSAK